MKDEITITLNKEELEELLHAVSTSYMDYDERLYHDVELQEEYNKGVEKFNNMIDNIRIKLKEGLKNVQK